MNVKNIFISATLSFSICGGAFASDCGPDSMFIRAASNDWNAVAMTCENNLWHADIHFTPTDYFKFEITGETAWGESYGDINQNGANSGNAEQTGQNIYVPQGGNYHVQFDYLSNKAYQYELDDAANSCGTEQMFIRGTFNAWTNMDEMECVDKKWQAIVSLVDGDEFKFEVTGSDAWGENYGDEDGTGFSGNAEANASNIAVNLGDGDYLVVFDYISVKYYEIYAK